MVGKGVGHVRQWSRGHRGGCVGSMENKGVELCVTREDGVAVGHAIGECVGASGRAEKG
jgi:hypothetical protein